MKRLRIRNWDSLYENNRSRALKRLDWVPIPNAMDGLSYVELIDHPNGAAHFGAWIAIIEIASRQEVRGTIPHHSAGIAQALARISRIPAGIFTEALPRLIAIGWIEEYQEVTEIRHEGAGIAQADAGIRHEGALNGREENGREENGKQELPATAAELSEVVSISSTIKYGAAWFDAQHMNWYHNAYWRRVGPKDSRRAYEKTIRKMAASEADFERCAALLFDAAVNDRQRFQNTGDWDWRQNLHPATWLNGERWLDEPKARGQPASQSKKVGFVESVRQEFGKQLAREREPLC